MKRPLVIVILLAGLSSFFSCRKEVATTSTRTIHDTVQHAWQAEPAFNNFDQDISSAFAANGKACFYGAQSDNFYTYDFTNNQWAYNSLYNNPLTNRRPAMCKDFFAFAGINNNYFGFVYPYYPLYNSTNYNKIKVYDTNFVSFPSFPTYFTSNSVNNIDISDSNRVIYPVITKDSTKSYFDLFDVKFSHSTYLFTVSNYHKVALGHSYSNSAPYVTYLNNRFFVNLGDTTYLIREDFSTKPVVSNDMFYCVFQYQGNYYATGNQNLCCIYKTTNLGETWSLQFTINGTNRYGLVIRNFDNNLIAILADQLWLVTMTSTTLTLKEIVNDGFVGKTITGLVKCNNKVWITTNGGVYYRPYAQFYQYK
ncbi:MAG TPA: hypothetical protein VF411_03735 [Bacteroidia bacterium]